MNNIILNVDSYKVSHYLQYPDHTEYTSCYIESRGPSKDGFTRVLFFGLQMFIKEYLLKPISQEDIDEAAYVFEGHGEPFNKEGWEYILNEHQGFLPLEIEAIPEGTLIGVKNVLVQVKNTDPKCYWLPGYIETALLRAVWYPTTVATNSYKCKQLIKAYLEQTSDSIDGLPFKLHDFGGRGVSSEESAGIGGLAHLVNFMGTDTVSALVAGRRYYDADIAGFSIPAAEHSTITSWEYEGSAYANMIKKFGGEGKTFAVVTDSYDHFNAIQNIFGGDLHSQVSENEGMIVFRPDSGNPAEIVVETVKALARTFGSTINSKGYRVLPNNIRVIQGDGISYESIEEILSELDRNFLSTDNVAFGMGAELLQKCNRDTFRFAMKLSAIQVNNKWRDVFKDPVTDPGKKSKRGRLAVVKTMEDRFVTVRVEDLKDNTNCLRSVYKDGELLVNENLDTIRKRCN